MPKVKKKKLHVEISLHLRYLYHDLGIKGKALLKRYPSIPKATIYRHLKKPIGVAHEDKRHKNPGRPSKLSVRDKRTVIRRYEQVIDIDKRDGDGQVSVKRISLEAGLADRVSDETVRRVLRGDDLRYINLRKKGILLERDLRHRLHFAKMVRRKGLAVGFWTNGISFYFDGVGFVHKFHPLDQAMAPRTKGWARRKEGLKYQKTAKGKREGDNGRVAHFLCAISYERGVIIAEQYFGNLNGEFFADFVRRKFPEMFAQSVNPRGKLFLQDGDPSQKSALSKKAVYDVNGKEMCIPARSPDLNPIENVFHNVKRKMRQDALTHKIDCEKFEAFSERCKQTLLNFDVGVIDRTIASMDKRIGMVIKAKGGRIKY